VEVVVSGFVRVNEFEVWTPGAWAFDFVVETWQAKPGGAWMRELIRGLYCLDLRLADEPRFASQLRALEVARESSQPSPAWKYAASLEEVDDLIAMMRSDRRAPTRLQSGVYERLPSFEAELRAVI